MEFDTWKSIRSKLESVPSFNYLDLGTFAYNIAGILADYQLCAKEVLKNYGIDVSYQEAKIEKVESLINGIYEYYFNN